MSSAQSVSATVSDPTRARMLELIMDEPEGRSTVTRLAEQLGLRQPTITHHAKVLMAVGVLERRPEGRRVWYSVAPAQLDRVIDIVGTRPGAVADDGVMERVVDDLAVRFAGTFSRETVERFVAESHGLLARAGHERQLASRTAEFASQRLAAVAARTRRRSEVPEVLFVCVQNAGRSQMAAALLRQLAGDRIRVRTAGSEPATAVAPVVASVLEEVGVPLGGEFPKPLTDEVVRAADVVITMGCGDACPVYPGTRYLDWELEDPVGRPIEQVREIRDAIDRRVRDLIASLDVASE
ncbi:metalloregulator ArsR/SmtB family transcription factor [Agromyces endophyticus]|uniref:metalloregulator ArsR/SmtB family transcription factor n=1 Tax=Agromyces sp. H17E-10 TaxID=2932244 RepID=UPI001FD2E582|nr:metalloregulator ArsR/SmtB family transcription factor [Agromyces sp. H17E-10]UOQ91077.1 metalloregulator ArsR/SmtB family transcription factor [Agromyces sp. H17E-10]